MEKFVLFYDSWKEVCLFWQRLVCLFVWTESVKFDIRVFICIGKVTLDRISSIWTGE